MARKKKEKSLFADIPLFDVDRVPAPPEDVASKGKRQRQSATACRGPTKAGNNDRTGQSPVPTKETTAAEQPTPESANGTHSRPLTVGQLAEGIRGVLDACLADVWVVGQVSGLKQGAGGHIYFDLKDAAAVVGCIMFAGARAKLDVKLENGAEIIVRGRVDFYPRTGRCSLIVTHLEQRGVGALEIKFRQMKERLEKEGLFARERKKPLPAFPQTIGVVTSPTGAAIRDILHVLGRRWPAVRVLVYGVAVQGPGAAEEIARAVRDFDRYLADEVDVLIVGRGGGSMEDLWAFNEEVVARAIAACRIPVVSAVGHETDFSISDFVADVRAPTPSAAAEIVVPDRRQLAQRLVTDARRLDQAAQSTLRAFTSRWRLAAEHRFFKYPEEIAGRRAARLDELAAAMSAVLERRVHDDHRRLHELERRLTEQRPTARLAAQAGRLAAIEVRLHGAARRLVERTAARSQELGRRLEALGPLAVLRRGYSLTIAARTGRPVRSADEVAAGDELWTTVASREEIRSRVV